MTKYARGMRQKQMRANSILQNTKKCYVTGSVIDLQCHHIYYGFGNRKISDKNGFWVWLTGIYHNQDKELGVHFDNKELDLKLKCECQRKYEETHSREEFMKLIGKNYL
jgi:hypothetical protein